MTPMNSRQLSENLKKVRATINTYGSKKVRLIAVSKNFPIEYIFGSWIIDYIVKGILFTYRFESGRWIKLKT